MLIEVRYGGGLLGLAVGFGVVLASELVEEDGGTVGLARLFHGFDFALLLSVLPADSSTSPLSYPFIIEQ